MSTTTKLKGNSELYRKGDDPILEEELLEIESSCGFILQGHKAAQATWPSDKERLRKEAEDLLSQFPLYWAMNAFCCASGQCPEGMIVETLSGRSFTASRMREILAEARAIEEAVCNA